VLALVAGVFAMGASGLAHGRIDRATVGVALVNAVVIAVYSVIDGEGARLSGPTAAHAFGYNAWADFLTALLYAPLLVAWRGRAALSEFARAPLRAAAGGAAAFIGYALVVWAMTRAEIGAVAAVRESSVVFAAVIGVFVLGEPFKPARAGRRRSSWLASRRSSSPDAHYSLETPQTAPPLPKVLQLSGGV